MKKIMPPDAAAIFALKKNCCAITFIKTPIHNLHKIHEDTQIEIWVLFAEVETRGPIANDQYDSIDK